MKEEGEENKSEIEITELKKRYLNGGQLTNNELLLVAVKIGHSETREEIFRKLIKNGSSLDKSTLFTIIVLSSSVEIKTAAAEYILEKNKIELNEISIYRFIPLTKNPFPSHIRYKIFEILYGKYPRKEDFEKVYTALTRPCPSLVDLRGRVG